MGLFVIVMFLPGVAIGDNLTMLLKALGSPFQILSNNDSKLIDKVSSLLILNFLFLAWTKAQQRAINGDKFNLYLKSLPINNRSSNLINIFILLLSNHFLWVLMISNLVFILNTTNSMSSLIQYLLLVLLLLTTQFISIFNPKANYFFILIILNSILLLPMNLIWQLVVFFCLSSLLTFSLQPLVNKSVSKLFITSGFSIKYPLSFYLQMLFKSNFHGSLFRLTLCLFLISGFVLSSTHFKSIGQGKIFPYLIILEGLLAFYLSGFFVLYHDQRKSMNGLLLSLPIPRFYWFSRDLLAAFLLSALCHLILFWGIYSSTNHTFKYFLYHLLLLASLYPIRIYIKNYQTFASFIFFILLSIITIINFS